MTVEHESVTMTLGWSCDARQEADGTFDLGEFHIAGFRCHGRLIEPERVRHVEQ